MRSACLHAKRSHQAAGGVQTIAFIGVSTSVWASALVKFDSSLVERRTRTLSACALEYLTKTLTSIVNGHKQSRIEELLPWNSLAT